MDATIDWLSFTLPTKQEPRTAQALYQDARQKTKELNCGLLEIIFDGQGLDPTGSRSPYRVALGRDDNGARIYGSSHTGTMLFELTGKGCGPLHDEKTGRAVVGCIHQRVTRFDIAVDIRTQLNPAEFANERSHDRFRSVSFIRSATGETVYVGSPKSDRFCRIYRYNHPHPRAELLRVEFVFRRKLARDAALQYSDEGNSQDFVARLGNTYGFVHQEWQPGSQTDERLRVPVMMRDDADTVYWLYHQVAPAITRLMDAGAFDIVEWLEHVYGTAHDDK